MPNARKRQVRAWTMESSARQQGIVVPVVNWVGPLGDPPLAAPERVRTAGALLGRRARRHGRRRRIVRP